ncbi:hypothetical protein HDU99_004312 [Rhizoclosmatium hyalinum]|nr:hypothetical protein HDU99_004312 [Rhizoclosmatium hyalinum]
MTKTRRDIGVERMGTYMLGGWVLTDSSCLEPGCNMPTFRSKDKTRLNFCCLCHDPKQPLPPVEAEAVSESEVQAEQVEPDLAEEDDQDDIRPPPISHNSTESDRVSALMGQKLLAGWTMLSATCPKCHITPLMEKAGHASVCVKCGSDSTASVQVVQPSKFAKITETIKIQRGPKEQDNTEEEMKEDDEEFWNELLESAPPSKYTVVPPPNTNDNRRQHVPSKQNSSSTTVVQSLEQHLESLSSSLTRSSSNYAEIKAICEAIKAAAEALEACRRL